MSLSEDRWGEIFAKRPTTIKLDLTRMTQALEELNLEVRHTPCVLIGGTNGKGSTSGMLWRLLSSLGFRVGLFTSPHLRHFGERIQVNGLTLTEDFLWREFLFLKQKLSQNLYADLTFFEVTTLLGIHVFESVRTDFNVFEVGMGGRLDATNILDPVASAVVSIGYDHQEFLGSTLGEIAREKLGIARSGRPLVWGVKRGLNPDVDMAYDEALSSVGFLPIEPQNYRQEHIHLSPVLQGNFRIAATLLQELVGAEKTQIALKRFGEADLPWPVSLRCRTEFFQVPKHPNQKILLDVCHNIDSVLAFVGFIKEQKMAPLPGAVAILRDKNFNAMLDELRLVLSPIVLFSLKHERSWSENLLAERHRDLRFFSQVDEIFRLEAFSRASIIAGCGSFYAVNQICEYLDLLPNPSLVSPDLG